MDVRNNQDTLGRAFFSPHGADRNTAAPAGVSAQPASARKKERKKQQEIKAEKEREASVRLDGYTVLSRGRERERE